MCDTLSCNIESRYTSDRRLSLRIETFYVVSDSTVIVVVRGITLRHCLKVIVAGFFFRMQTCKFTYFRVYFFEVTISLPTPENVFTSIRLLLRL
jgi:hypothetical protein